MADLTDEKVGGGIVRCSAKTADGYITGSEERIILDEEILLSTMFFVFFLSSCFFTHKSSSRAELLSNTVEICPDTLKIVIEIFCLLLK